MNLLESGQDLRCDIVVVSMTGRLAMGGGSATE